ncbi:ornithine cyclodeaminase [Cupriavidus plantarum]|uniref:ornithine cyclodeaminase n=1 Tax=Cupriavidus plantarum TaxID=942865 RepID=UPI001B164BBA|nr:ornithine cyclodeaminase [Cupriavidus plantarum]CAG2126816.1 Ornithine cyclodeaminase [Cupriavidus plantarum]SMR67732.1 ornithine cyclodeaminase [Cupriavidus plantarum]
MTRFLSPADVAHIVATQGLPHVLRHMARYIEQDYLRWQDFDKTARTAAHSARGVIELMPIADDSHYSFKYVNGHPANTADGLPTVMAFGTLADVSTGMPLLLSELTLTTALRTAATSVVAARRLARQDAATMALIGNGAQAEFQALAFHYLLGIRTLRVYDTDAAATRKLAGNLRDIEGLVVVPCASTAEAVRGADIVTTVTADKAYATIVTPDMLAPGMHLNAVGGDCPGKTELHPDVLRRARVFVEYEPQSRIEGDCQQMPADFAVTELWQVLAGRLSGRTEASEITVFDSVGFALEDYSALRYLRDSADALGLGQTLDLVPRQADPKDLFGLLPVRRVARAPAIA